MTAAKTSIARLFRPPWNFEEDYAGHPGSTPILFTHPFNPVILPPGTPDIITALDPEAAGPNPTQGISPLLARFCPVPIGATAAVYFPIVRVLSSDDDIFPDGWGYVWRVVFRFRSVADYVRRRKNRVPYSLGVGRMGAPDTRAGTVPDRPALPIAGSRVIRPATIESIIYNRSAPSSTADPPFFGSLRSDAVVIPVNLGAITTPAIYPGAGAAIPGNVANLDYEQGETDPNLTLPDQDKVSGATHLVKFVKCTGNEMAVECFKYNLEASGNPYSPRPWQFNFDEEGVLSGEDLSFSTLMGVGARSFDQTPPVDTGVRVVTGSWPR